MFCVLGIRSCKNVTLNNSSWQQVIGQKIKREWTKLTRWRLICFQRDPPIPSRTKCNVQGGKNASVLKRGYVTVVQLIFSNFAKYSPSIAMELKESKEITCKWQNQIGSETYTYVSWALFLKLPAAGISFEKPGAPNGNFGENICSEDDLRTRIFGTFVVKFLACLPLLGFSNIYKMV